MFMLYYVKFKLLHAEIFFLVGLFFYFFLFVLVSLDLTCPWVQKFWESNTCFEVTGKSKLYDVESRFRK